MIQSLNFYCFITGQNNGGDFTANLKAKFGCSNRHAFAGGGSKCQRGSLAFPVIRSGDYL